jgi:hypothetical protein
MPKQAQPPAPVAPIIHPDQVFSLAALQSLLALRPGSLPREIREGRLRSFKRCGRRWIFGSDVLAWLRGGAQRKQPGSLTTNGRAAVPRG